MCAMLFIVALCLAFPLGAAESGGKREKVVIVVHGGMADMDDRKEMTPELEKEKRRGLEAAARAGYEKLKKHGSSLDAVEAAIRVMEDDPQFNAGKGAVFTDEGKNELDAAIMDGKTMKAGAVAGVTVVRNPISAARAVMEKTRHVLLVSKGAEQFAREAGLEIVDPPYFYTERRWQELQKALAKEKAEKEKDKSGAVGLSAEEALGDRRRRGPGRARQSGRGHVNGRPDEQAARPRGRFAHHRRRDLCRQRRRGDLLHRRRRVLHPLLRRPQRRLPDEIQGLADPESG